MKERVGSVFDGLASRKEKVERRCRTVLESRFESLSKDIQTHSRPTASAHSILALV